MIFSVAEEDPTEAKHIVQEFLDTGMADERITATSEPQLHITPKCW